MDLRKTVGSWPLLRQLGGEDESGSGEASHDQAVAFTAEEGAQANAVRRAKKRRAKEGAVEG